ncbi:unnamed protein product [Brassicogethes aeneus]|uniref:MADF domain-containing protein n=1 Tax=Brassicogethes aeneus TaxID=1431903 RepID=A0A9P0BF18_BRAAE|nr:unnamed protein product [Brassicogethes aeneus]
MSEKENTCVPEEFIAKIMEYPFLYNIKQSMFKDAKKKERIWNEIGENFNHTGEEAKQYFKSLKKKFGRIKKQREKATKSGAGALKQKDWELYQLIQFLEELIRPKKTSCSFETKRKEEILIEIDPQVSNEEMLSSGIFPR